MNRITILVLVLVACVGGACVGGEGEATVGTEERFAGDWMVDQPAHAGYEASVYRFSRDGSLTLRETCNLSGLGDDYVTGSVSSEAEAMRCEFGSGWHSLGLSTLVVDGRCSDDTSRDIELRFLSDNGSNTEGATVVVASVDGASGWDHNDFEWRWVKCPVQGCESPCSSL